MFTALIVILFLITVWDAIRWFINRHAIMTLNEIVLSMHKARVDNLTMWNKIKDKEIQFFKYLIISVLSLPSANSKINPSS